MQHTTITAATQIDGAKPSSASQCCTARPPAPAETHQAGNALGRGVFGFNADGRHGVAPHAYMQLVAAAEDALDAEAGAALPQLARAPDARVCRGLRAAVVALGDRLRDRKRHRVHRLLRHRLGVRLRHGYRLICTHRAGLVFSSLCMAAMHVLATSSAGTMEDRRIHATTVGDHSGENRSRF